ncbi:hypothetical protein AAVH_01099 [Aphelenchoides avenae]|nr:hypothetical protein AAVH_01099 [Aphelenchus avenae]
MCCLCLNLHRHQIHLISYGFVAFSLIVTGLVFTVFAIFQKESQIGKVWLAGPTTMVVGLVLVGKVVIDWGPAMLSGREGTIDSFLDQMAGPPISSLNGEPKLPPPKAPLLFPHNDPCLKLNGNAVKMPHQRLERKPTELAAGQEGAIDCIVYGQFDSVSNSNASSTMPQLPLDATSALAMGSNAATTPCSLSRTMTPTPLADSPIAECHCAEIMANRYMQDYGSMGETSRPFPSRSNMYQGETFIINDKSYYI